MSRVCFRVSIQKLENSHDNRTLRDNSISTSDRKWKRNQLNVSSGLTHSTIDFEIFLCIGVTKLDDKFPCRRLFKLIEEKI